MRSSFHEAPCKEIAELELRKLNSDSMAKSDPMNGEKTNREHFVINKEQKRHTFLVDQITDLARKRYSRQEEIMSNHLFNDERPFVHEEATELEMKRRSKGIEGVD
jgi:hypothetical protein